MSRKLKDNWQLQEAKSKLSEVVKKATRNRPQIITVHGRPAVVVISVDEYKKLIRPTMTLIEFLDNSPLKRIHLDLERSRDFGRDVDL